MKKLTNKELTGRLAIVGAGWLLASILLHRTGFTYSDQIPFDWQGLLFMAITISIAIYGFSILKASQSSLKHSFVIYGLAWLIPLIIVGAAVAGVTSQDHTNTAAPNYCSTNLLPNVCRVTDGPTGKVVETTYQSGYGVTIVMAGAVAYSIYHSLKSRIKGHSREDLFQ